MFKYMKTGNINKKLLFINNNNLKNCLILCMFIDYEMYLAQKTEKQISWETETIFIKK